MMYRWRACVCAPWNTWFVSFSNTPWPTQLWMDELCQWPQNNLLQMNKKKILRTCLVINQFTSEYHLCIRNGSEVEDRWGYIWVKGSEMWKWATAHLNQMLFCSIPNSVEIHRIHLQNHTIGSLKSYLNGEFTNIQCDFLSLIFKFRSHNHFRNMWLLNLNHLFI